MSEAKQYESPFPYNHQIVNGCMVPPFFTQEAYDNAQKNQPFKDGDVLICTYPKSGTTFAQNIVYNLLHGPIPDSGLHSVSVWHETAGNQPLSDEQLSTLPDSRRVWKSHLCWEDTFQTEKDIKYIYVARNGKDVAVSLFHHACGFQLFGYAGTWEDWYERCMSGQVEFGFWYKHVLGWWEASKKRDDVLYLFYEDFVKEPEQFIRRVAEFIGVELTDELLERVLRVTSFDYMKSNIKTNYGGGRKQGSKPFMRKGKVGDWKETFTSAQAARFDKLYQSEIVDKSDLHFQFE